MNAFKTSLITGSIACLIFTNACKPKPSTPPLPDTDTQSSVDATFALRCVTDIDMICAYVAEGNYGTSDATRFFEPNPDNVDNGITGIYAPIRHDDNFIVGYNKTSCYDGHMREGTITLDYNNPVQGTWYYRNYKFKGKLTLSEYKIDGWKIATTNGVPCSITNLLQNPAFSPQGTKLSWLIDGSFDFIHPSDPSKNFTWKGKITKTLLNTSDPLVYPVSGMLKINWNKAQLSYEGEASATDASGKSYKIELSSSNPLVRDFTCSPDQVGGLQPDPIRRVWRPESHPFVRGIAFLTPENASIRQVFYGNEGDPSLEFQCDNSGQVAIRGINYKVDFEK